MSRETIRNQNPLQTFEELYSSMGFIPIPTDAQDWEYLPSEYEASFGRVTTNPTLQELTGIKGDLRGYASTEHDPDDEIGQSITIGLRSRSPFRKAPVRFVICALEQETPSGLDYGISVNGRYLNDEEARAVVAPLLSVK